MKNFEFDDDDLQNEYDFKTLEVVKRGTGRSAPQPRLLVELDADVAEKFPNSQAVNEALRFLIRATQSLPK